MENYSSFCASQSSEDSLEAKQPMPLLIIVGASGHGKVAADIAFLNGYTDIVFLDDDLSKTDCAGYPVIGTSALIPQLEGQLFIAVGNGAVRQRLMEQHPHRNYPNLIHPTATIARSVRLGRGSLFVAGSVVNPDSIIGDGCIVNTCASVGHDCVLKDYVHVSSGVRLAGTTVVGERTWIGVGSTVSNNISICPDCMIGAGAVVVKDIKEAGTYVGVPARKLEKR